MVRMGTAERLRRVVASLGDIAASVGRDAAAATQGARRAAARAEQTAAHAADLAALATSIEAALAAQQSLFDEARAAAADNAAVLSALGAAAEGIDGVTGLIASIAGSSRLLALNARIEAARTGEAGLGFGVVAGEMTSLARQTWDATRDIEGRTERLRSDVNGTARLFEASVGRVARQAVLADELVASADLQQAKCEQVVASANDAVRELEEATLAIGRVTSAARNVEVIARQVVRAADDVGEPASRAA